MQVLHPSQGLALDEAVRCARDWYGLEVSAQRWPGEYDQNFRLEASDGRTFVLKVMHPSRDASFVDLQCKALRRIEESAPTLAVSRVIATTGGERFTTVTDAQGEVHIAWLLTHVSGEVMANVRPHSAAVLADLGTVLGHVDRALDGFSHPAARRDFKWDLSRATWICDHVDAIADRPRRALVQRAIDLYRAEVVPRANELRRGVIYGDANDYNVLLDWHADQARWSVGLIDFGDMHEGWPVAESAVAAAYALLGANNSLAAAAAVVKGFHSVLSLSEAEVSALFPLIVMRLAVSVVNSALRTRERPGDPYVTISEAPAWAALERLQQVHPRFATYAFRHACGYEPVPRAVTIRRWLSEHRDQFAPIVDEELRAASAPVLDLGIGSLLLGSDPQRSTGVGRARAISDVLRASGDRVGIGRYGEARWVADACSGVGADEADVGSKTIHLGVDVFTTPGTAVYAPLDGTVRLIARPAGTPGDGGAEVVVAHRAGEAGEFYTIYRHLAPDSVVGMSEGQILARGAVVGCTAAVDDQRSGGAHLHFQLATDLLDNGALPGMARAQDRAIWADLSPDPNLVLGIPAERFPVMPSRDDTLVRRRRLLGPSLSVSYREPLKIVRGWRQYLYDDAGRPYLDVFNNVPLIGHSHPRVVEAVTRQLALLNTNTRYLHDGVLDYAERLVALLPPPLHVCYFVNSGSEANELAIRMARTHTRAEDVIVLENAYHGNTGTVTDISPYKFDGPGGTGRKPWVHVAPVADDYRGKYRRGEPELGQRYAEDVERTLEGIKADGRRVAAYIAESMPSVGGQIVFPDGYLAGVYRYVRAAGGVCIADEVQVGFGRLGEFFWGFEQQRVIPDIVVLAKPIGNCFPLAAVVTTEEIADSFNNGMEFFSTYGGNPVSCAAGLAVLDVVRDEHLQAHAGEIGGHLLARLRELERAHAIIGDVRGMGLFLGVDLVRDRATREPATARAAYAVNRLRERGVLAGTDGPFHNVLKFRPPLNLAKDDADRFIDVLDSVLQEYPLARGIA